VELGRVLEYETAGRGDAVLFIHGAIIADSFAPIMREEALTGFQLIRYRRRGFGRSATPSEPPTIEEHARDAKALLLDLGVSEAHVVAHSGGGPIAVQLAIDDPDMVRSMVLLEPALMNATMAAGFHDMITPLIEMHAVRRSADAVDLWMSAGNADWKALIEQRIPGAAAQAIADAAGTFDFDLRAMRVWDFDAVGASRISQPVLYVTGTRSGHRPNIAAMFQNAVQQTRAEAIPDADHIALMTDPSAVAAVVAVYLHRQPTGSDPTRT
jgi:pimeloyl-ACP methyl ester carboxylesterase